MYRGFDHDGIPPLVDAQEATLERVAQAGKARRIVLDRDPFEGIDGHVGQVDVLRAALQHEFVFLTSGRGYGKSPLAGFVVIAEGGSPGMAGQVYEYLYGAPFDEGAALDTYKYHKRIFAALLSDHMGLTNGYSDTQKTLHLRAFGGNKGAVLDYVGLDNHDAARRYRRHRIVIDEFKDVPEEAYRDTLLPMRIGRSPGGVLGLGSPKRVGLGVAWARSEWRRGQDPIANPYHRSFWAPSYANPFLTMEEFERIKAGCKNDPLAYQEEVEGRWLEGEGAVFSNLNAVFIVEPIRTMRCSAGGTFIPETDPTRVQLWIGEDPDEGTTTRLPDEYGGAIDLARAPDGDYTVLTIFNRRTRRQAVLLRIHGILYMDQLPFVASLLARYGGVRTVTIYDATGGHGSALTEPLARLYGEGMRARTWNATTKGEDITHAQNLCAQAGKDEGAGYGWYLMKVPWQRAEWDEYQAITKTKEGRPLSNFVYGAPPKMHDDSVSAGCLAAPLLVRPHVVRPVVKQVKVGSAAWLDQDNDGGSVYTLR